MIGKRRLDKAEMFLTTELAEIAEESVLFVYVYSASCSENRR